MIDADELKNRFRETVQEVDARGRAIVVGRLKLSQQSRLFEMTERSVNQVMYAVVASVRQIVDDKGDPTPLAFPANTAEVLARLDMLDREGLVAASKAYRKINGIPEEGDGSDAEGLDAALA